MEWKYKMLFMTITSSERIVMSGLKIFSSIEGYYYSLLLVQNLTLIKDEDL